MKVTILHGQAHKGTTYAMTCEVVKQLGCTEDDMREFFLPKDGPGFCQGCFRCFLDGEEFCPDADRVQPIIKAMEWADIVILDSPNYVMEMSGPQKNMMDHLAYRWVTHRPHGSMFTKVGIVVSSSAGAPPVAAVRSMAKQLRWLGVPKVYKLGVACFVAPGEHMSVKKKAEVDRRVRFVASQAKRRASGTRTSLSAKLKFGIFRKMQSSLGASWNPTDRDWWVHQGWTADVRPWKYVN